MPRQAVVLAAGVGSRLRPLTDSTPKCLLEVGGKTILDRLLDDLAKAGVERAVIVTGYLGRAISAHLDRAALPCAVELVENAEYETTNNAASLFVAQKKLRAEAFLLCDGDVVLKNNPVRALRAEPEGCALLVDPSVKLGAEEMKAEVDGDGRVLRLSKELEPARCLGESIGIQKVGGGALVRLWEELDRMMHGGRKGAYYEEAFQRLIDQGVTFRAVLVEPGAWTEIDDLADLEDARARFACA
jgi:choline kinase